MRDQKEFIDINKLDHSGFGLIHHAALTGNSEIMQIFVNFEGVDLGLKTRKGETAI
jgi:hypothetical protein